jgi:hypothetical protein
MPSLEIAAPAQPTAIESARARGWSLLAVGLFAFAFWMLQDPYDGLIHDGVLYAFSALARLHPGSLGHDVMLTLGSQDKLTVFSPVAAAVFRVFGLEHGAALLTCVMFAAFIACCWLLARRIMSVELAVLAVGLIIVLPSEYGSGYLFAYVEPFMTPRPAAEAMVLAGIAAALGGRYPLCALCMLGGLLLHGIMAAAGIAFVSVMYIGWRRPLLTVAIALCGLAVLTVAAFAVPFGPVSRLDPFWLNFLRTRLPYLFPTLWQWNDWSHAAIPFAVLAVGMTAHQRPLLRRLCASAALTGLGGVALSIVGSDLLHIAVIAQAQTWRWLWLTNALAVLLLVPIGASCWTIGHAGRAAAILLAAAWVGIDESFAVLPALLAVVSAAAATRVQQETTARLFFLGACAILLLCFVAFCGSVIAVTTKLPTISPDRTLYTSPFLLALRSVRAWASGGVLTAALLIAVWLSQRNTSPPRTTALLMAGAMLCVAISPLAWHAWSRVTFTDSVRNEFAGWRAQIAEDAQVLWVDSATGPWFALGRASYWSLQQMAGLVFSRPLTVEMDRREKLLTRPRTRAESSLSVLDYTCASNPALDYIVSPRDLGPTPFPPVSGATDSGTYRMLLYRCADHRH